MQIDRLPGKRIDPQIKQSTTAKLWVVQPAVGITLERHRKVCKNSPNVSNDLFLVDQPLDLLADREEPRPDGFHEKKLFGRRDLGEMSGLASVDGD